MADVFAPTVVASSPQNEATLVCMPDESLRIYYVERPEGTAIRSRGSTNGGLTWGDDRHEFDLPGAAYYAVQVLLDHEGELHAVFHIFRGQGRKPGVDRNLDVWHCRTTDRRSLWGKPQRIYEGYVGSIRGALQLDSGRIIVPFAIAIPDRWTPPPAGEPDYGWHNIAVMFSDDAGDTWRRSPDKLKIVLCGENVTRYGAIEPHVIELKDGRIWMLIRDRCGRLYESYSTDGIHWSDPQQTRFISSDSPATTVRLPDDRIILFWCADQRWDNSRSYAMGGREVLHAAISPDEGRTWQGFREVLTEPLPPVDRGDRGTAYPSAVCNSQGKVVLASGQGHGRQAIVLFDPDWLKETTAHDDFSAGLEQWTLYGAQGSALIQHPDQPDRRALSIQKTDPQAPAGALWNFPAGASGELQIRLRPTEDFDGAMLWLTDHFSVIDDADAPANAIIQIPITLDERREDAVFLKDGRWTDMTLTWLADRGTATISLDGRPALTVESRRRSATGISYFGIRSMADEVESGGVLIDSVDVNVTPPPLR